MKKGITNKINCCERESSSFRNKEEEAVKFVLNSNSICKCH
jgi:hypothetical protein